MGGFGSSGQIGKVSSSGETDTIDLLCLGGNTVSFTEHVGVKFVYIWASEADRWR